MSKPILWTKDFICITLCNLFVFLAFYYLIVTLPIYTITELNGTETEAGLIITLFLITAIFIRPFAGKWALSIGNKNILFIGLFIFIISSGLYLISDSVYSMMFIRLLHGVGFGMATTATGSIVANVIPDSRKGEGMGYYSLSFNIAVVLGPFIGLTAILQWSTVTLFSIVAISSFVALAMGLLVSKENRKIPEAMTGNPQKHKLSIVEKTAIRISIVAAIFAIIYSSILSFVPVYAEEVGLIKAASYFFVVYAAIMLLSRPFTGRWLDQYGCK
ncbi:MFS transporter [Alkalihalobacterium alkalinitrilicum]|uniref:MFS transporter n=1 Tax=Alkalihalobacterium alkalinitrilicum TaxID=427920 RepID=UPI00308453BF